MGQPERESQRKGGKQIPPVTANMSRTFLFFVPFTVPPRERRSQGLEDQRRLRFGRATVGDAASTGGIHAAAVPGK